MVQYIETSAEACFKEMVHPKMKIVSLITPSCHSKPARASFFNLWFNRNFMKLFLCTKKTQITT